jgi:hypothetical protein
MQRRQLPAESGRAVPDGSSPAVAPSTAAIFQATLDLFETGVTVMRQNLRRRHPHAADEEIERHLRRWLLERPGAEAGDSAGRRIDLDTRRA